MQHLQFCSQVQCGSRVVRAVSSPSAIECCICWPATYEVSEPQAMNPIEPAVSCVTCEVATFPFCSCHIVSPCCRYEAGQHFLAHEDGFPALLATANGFQRHATLLLYLNDVQQVGFGKGLSDRSVQQSCRLQGSCFRVMICRVRWCCMAVTQRNILQTAALHVLLLFQVTPVQTEHVACQCRQCQ